MDRRPGWHWSDYWRSGRVEVMTVGTADGAAPYDAAPLWDGFVRSLPDGARLIDLATGGGQVPRIASAAAREQGKTLEIIGVDYADLGPSAGAASAGAYTLMGGIALERLPFPAAHFEAATSQFGIEYADSRPALTELSRVLKPDGRALLLIHHAESAVGRWTADQLAAFDRVVGEGAAMRLARRAFTAHAKRLPTEALRTAEAAFREAVQRMAERLEPTPAFDHARDLVAYLDDLSRSIGRYEPASAIARLDQAEGFNAAWRQRQRSQLAAALDQAGLDAFLQRAARAGLTVTGQGVEHDAKDSIVGWRLELTKA
jgi:ubiquinone/menaquinone biosynthesis C-methylase UbiE